MPQKDYKIPEATVQRLSIYLRSLENLEREGQKIVSSYDLAKICGFKAAQIRKDFAYFGELGVRGVGYYIKDRPAEDRTGYALESPAGTFPALAINGSVTEEELHKLVDSLTPAKDYLKAPAGGGNEQGR